MTEGFNVRRGKKLDDEDTKAAMRSGKFLLMLARPDQDVVEAQGAYSGWTQCPNCGHVGWTVGLGTVGVQQIVCGACGKGFTVG